MQHNAKTRDIEGDREGERERERERERDKTTEKCTHDLRCVRESENTHVVVGGDDGGDDDKETHTAIAIKRERLERQRAAPPPAAVGAVDCHSLALTRSTDASSPRSASETWSGARADRAIARRIARQTPGSGRPKNRGGGIRVREVKINTKYHRKVREATSSRQSTRHGNTVTVPLR